MGEKTRKFILVRKFLPREYQKICIMMETEDTRIYDHVKKVFPNVNIEVRKETNHQGFVLLINAKSFSIEDSVITSLKDREGGIFYTPRMIGLSYTPDMLGDCSMGSKHSGRLLKTIAKFLLYGS